MQALAESHRPGQRTVPCADAPSDLWSDWLLHRRHGGDPAYGEAVRRAVERYADRVLDGARLRPDMVLADVGAGEGLIAFRAIDRLGPSLRVILTDVSQPMLRHAEDTASRLSVRSQCRFLRCGAERLEGIEDASVDVVATRSVLAYVADKQAALAEFRRVLKPGGRISIAEPILQDEAFAARALKAVIDARPAQVRDRFMPLLQRWKAAQFPDTEQGIARSPIANYSERDLVRFALEAGYADIHLELHIDVQPTAIKSWEVFVDHSPHPWAPPLRAILAERFTADERALFERVVRPTVESGGGLATDRMAYLTATKSAA